MAMQSPIEGGDTATGDEINQGSIKPDQSAPANRDSDTVPSLGGSFSGSIIVGNSREKIPILLLCCLAPPSRSLRCHPFGTSEYNMPISRDPSDWNYFLHVAAIWLGIEGEKGKLSLL